MRASELRLGNIVLYQGEPKKTVGITEEHPYIDDIIFDYLDWGEIEPIPITEEILLKCGDIKWLLSDSEGYYVLINNKKTRIFFVHSLQNIYLCIEQKELNLCL